MIDPTQSPGPERMVTRLFTNQESAERAYQSAIRLGYESSDIDVLMTEETRNRYFSPGHDTKTDLSSNATKDTAEDGKFADDLGAPPVERSARLPQRLPESVLSCSFPLLGVVAAGPLAAALTAAGLLALAGALMGVLTKWGFPNRAFKNTNRVFAPAAF